ncbi:hypothetical protein Tco_0774452 [Tanacetum coccineum]|uniref:Uncharacterized protein n=1 Tax=Tanacetum coccineum TaxID=301880 RepID=A0ABQ4ZR30_9ASTR
MSNTNLPTQTSSVLQNDTVSLYSTSKVQEKIQLSELKCIVQGNDTDVDDADTDKSSMGGLRYTMTAECTFHVIVLPGKISAAMAAEKADISETIINVDSQMTIQKNDV